MTMNSKANQTEQVLIELDYAIGELQRVHLALEVILSYEDQQTKAVKRMFQCIEHRIDSGKAIMFLVGYTPISYKQNEPDV